MGYLFLGFFKTTWRIYVILPNIVNCMCTTLGAYPYAGKTEILISFDLSLFFLFLIKDAQRKKKKGEKKKELAACV